MIWFFEKQGQQLRFEVRRAPEGAGYEIEIIEPDGSRRVETIASAVDLTKRFAELQDDLASRGWRSPHPLIVDDIIRR